MAKSTDWLIQGMSEKELKKEKKKAIKQAKKKLKKRGRINL